MNRLRELRKGKKLSITELHEATGISRSVLSNIETGVRRMNVNHARILSEYFGVSIDYILGNDLAMFMSFSNALEDLFQSSFDAIVEAAANGKIEDRERLLFLCVDHILHDALSAEDLKLILDLIQNISSKDKRG